MMPPDSPARHNNHHQGPSKQLSYWSHFICRASCCLDCRRKMSCVPEGIVCEDYFQFDQLDYPVYSRFLELLGTNIWRDFRHTSKKHYKDYITFVGIDMAAEKCPGRRKLHLREEWGYIRYTTAEDYRRLEQKYSKFWPYFKFHQLLIDFTTWDGQTIDRCPIPVPKMYWRLDACSLKQESDIDYLVKEGLHPGVEEIEFYFYEMELEEVMKLVNYTLTKIPGLSEYCFSIRTKKIGPNASIEGFRQLFKPPPTTREMTLEIDENHRVSYRIKKDD